MGDHNGLEEMKAQEDNFGVNFSGPTKRTQLFEAESMEQAEHI